MEDDSQTPPIPDDMIQIDLDSIRRSTSGGQDRDEGDDHEITFNFSLRHEQDGEGEMPSEEGMVFGEGVQARVQEEEEEEGDFMLPASAAEDVEMEMEEQMQTEGRKFVFINGFIWLCNSVFCTTPSKLVVYKPMGAERAGDRSIAQSCSYVPFHSSA